MDQDKAPNLNLFLTQGNKWKRLRALTANVLTTAKIKSVEPILHGVIKELVQTIKNEAQRGKEVVDLRE